MLDSPSDELATVVSQTDWTTLVTIDVTWRNFSESRVWDKLSEGSTSLIFGDTQNPS